MEPTSAREQEKLVELVDESGDATGVTTVVNAHRPPGRRHRAYSVLLVDPAGQLLLQQRAAVKTRFPLRWGNACCGHPAPGQPVVAEATGRLAEELGVYGVVLAELGVHRYRARDPVTGYVEHEHDHVLWGRLGPDQPVVPDPAEVAAVRRVEIGKLRADLVASPSRYVPWLSGVLDQLPVNGPG